MKLEKLFKHLLTHTSLFYGKSLLPIHYRKNIGSASLNGRCKAFGVHRLNDASNVPQSQNKSLTHTCNKLYWCLQELQK